MEGNPSLYISTLPKLIAIDIVLMNNYFSLSRDLTGPQDYMVM